MIKIVNALGIYKKTSPEGIKIDFIPLLDILVLCLLFTLFSSKFITAPGLTVTLPDIAIDNKCGLIPTSVLTISDTDKIFFEGKIWPIESLETAFNNYIQNHSLAQDATLLIKMSQYAHLETFFQISILAKHAGFKQIQIASKTNSNFLKNSY